MNLPRTRWTPGAYALVTTLFAFSLSALLAATSAAMPPPAPGNTEGLPASVRQLIAEDPTLFLPRTGFRPVIERQKAERARLVQQMLRTGYTLKGAQTASLARVTTTRYAPVLCGLYADKGSPDWPTADLIDQLFSLDYGATNTQGHPGSMREHYLDMSYGTFDLQGGVFGWYTLPQPGSFYYSDDNGLGVDRADGETGAYLHHTLVAADPGTDFSLYDNDGPDNIPNSGDDDGVVDLVMLVHPNEGGECGGDDIWSHSFVYSGWAQHSGPFVTNDIGFNGQPLVIDDYVIMPAVSCFGGRIEIGVFSHEFGHALGLPDLYDRTAYDPAGAVSTGGIGLFGLMAAGSYGGDYSHPATPTQMCAWSKEQLGWLAPREVVCDASETLYYLGDSADALKMWTGGDYSTGEYFLVENRQRKKWDKFLLGEGLLITHIDNNVLTQNDEACPGGNPCLASHYQVMVIEADNQWEMQTAAAPLAGPWFGEPEDFFSASNNDTWNDLTLPSARDHAGVPTGLSISNISTADLKMTLDVGASLVCEGVPSLSATDAEVGGGCDLDRFLDPGETVSLAVTVRNFPTALPATGISATLTSLTPSVTVVDGTAEFPDLDRGKFGKSIIPFRISADGTVACSTFASLRLDLVADGGYATAETLIVPLGLDSLFVPFPLFEDDMESGEENGWRHYAYINEDDWSHNTNGNHTVGAVPGNSWFAGAPATGKDVSLEPPAFIPGATSVVTFWHKYDFEDDWDGGVLELSTDNGATWVDVGALTSTGYDDTLTVNPQSSLSGRPAWNGLNPAYPLFDQVTLDMSGWSGLQCRLRFRLGTDLASSGVAVPGWNIDDYSINDAAILREQCEETALCPGAEIDPPVFAGLESAVNPQTLDCNAADLKWSKATDVSGPVTYLIYASTTTPVPTTSPLASTPLLKYRVEGLTPNQTYHFLVRARDSQGNVDGNMVEQTVALTCDPPVLALESFALTETESCDGDGQPDAGEAIALDIVVRNASFSNATGVQGTLTSLSGDLYVLQGSASYGDLGSQAFESGDQPYRVLVSPSAACQSAAQLQIEFTADGGYGVTGIIDLLLETDVTFQPLQFLDDMEGVEPNGFTHGAESGADDWGYVTSAAASPTHSWFASNQASITNAWLQSPPLYVTSTSVLTFQHRYVMESTYDGAVLEISTDDGATWTDIGQSYNSSLNATGPAWGGPFAPGQAFWSGDSGGFVTETVNLGSMTSVLGDPLYAGQVVLIRWRIGCDNSNTSPPHVGWWVDDISLTDSGTFVAGCDQTNPCATTDASDAGPRLGVTHLAQNVPNPMHTARTRIEYRVGTGDAGPVTLSVFDVNGRLVRTLVDSHQPAGAYQVGWDGRTETGGRVPAGMYFYELRAGAERQVRKLILID